MAMTAPVVDSVRESVFNAVTGPLFSKSSGFYYNSNLEWSVLLENLEAFPVNIKLY